MITATYLFTRDPVHGFFRQNTAATDSLNVLILWRDAAGGRTYKLLEDAGERLVARISLQTSDQPSAADDMERLCRDFGIARTVQEG
ncbi:MULTISPECIES: hypothetical protein [unclassified Acidovorax]|uniref:hypothetical protein n=1 Tax=unclassified Acidovorax TaxID=2684926 RepID=UPI002882D591|nr:MULTISPECIES: hypothetical protein [unclassified Acidovorax]